MATIDIILGPMFSGKSEELCRRIRRYEAINIKCLKINHTLDTRTDEFIQTHSNIKIPAIKSNILMPLKYSEFFKKSKVIAIDEAQFFNDLYPFVEELLKYNIHILLCGLNGDRHQKKFGQIIDLLPFANKVDKISGICNICNNGTPGDFTTLKKNNNRTENQILVGDQNIFLCVCRKHINY